jgi:hypothetical protein
MLREPLLPPVAHRSAWRLPHGFLFSAGLFLFASGFVLEALLVYWYTREFDRAVLLYPIYGVVQVVGLILVTVADVDANVFMKQHKEHGIAFAIAFLVHTGFEAFYPEPDWQNQVNWLKSLPFLYLLRNSQPVLDMADGCFQFTEILALSLVLDMICFAGYSVLLSVGKPGSWPTLFFAGFVFVGAALSWAHYLKRRQRGTLAMALNASIYNYLLVFGLEDLLYHLVSPDWKFENTERFLICSYLFSPVHVIPSLAMIFFRKRIYKMLGLLWQKQRIARDFQDGLGE